MFGFVLTVLFNCDVRSTLVCRAVFCLFEFRNTVLDGAPPGVDERLEIRFEAPVLMLEPKVENYKVLQSLVI